MPIIPGLCAACGGGGASDAIDTEPLLLCDINPATGEVVGSAIAVYTYDDTGAPTGPPTFVVPGTNNPYVVQFMLQPCDSEGQSAVVELCDVQLDNSSVQFVRHYIFGPTGLVASFHDSLPDGSLYVPTGTVQDCDPFALCTPDSNLDLNADCGPGQPVNKQILLDDVQKPLANDLFVDDATADPLCGGQWDRPGSPLAAPFPVSESFRNTTFDQPGPVLQGTPPFPQLTAGPPVNDGAGAGWLRVSDINSGTNGIWQVPNPFPTTQGVNAAITWASHDGTTPGGDGMAFVFTDGGSPAQPTPIGGFGNLGLQNWVGGYVAVVVDEYGQTCTCDQTAPPGGPNPGPCGFCTNTISIQLAGTARIGASCACCTIASAPLNPKALNLTTRSQPARVLTSIIAEGGQTFVSASIDWNDGNGPILYHDRVNVTACAGPPPASLRMASFGGSGGAYRAIKEFRDAVARPAGVSNWRAFPITTDPIVCPGPGTVSLVNITASVDVTVSDDGSQTVGNNNPEMYFWLVNSATNTVVARDSFSVLPSQIGNLITMNVAASVTPADVPNLRLYVGAESRDEVGEYSSLWENLTIGATAAGCPATPRRTMEISARCPIPVTVVGGSDDGGGGGTTVVNTPSTFEDALICATVGGVPQPGFRREIHTPDGNLEVTFIGMDGLPIVIESWTPGPCCCDQTLGPVCFTDGMLPITQTGFLAVDSDGNPILYSGTGAVVVGATIVICPETTIQGEILCDLGNANHQFLRWYLESPIVGVSSTVYNFELDGSTVYVPVGPVGLCDASSTNGLDVEVQVLCDATPTRFLRKYVYNADTGVFASITDTLLDGTTAFAPVGAVSTCPVSVTANIERDDEILVLCDSAAPTPNRFLRRYVYDVATGNLISITNTTLDGSTPFVPVGVVQVCPQTVTTDFDLVEEVLCDNNGGFIRRFSFNSVTGVLVSTANLTLAGAAYVPVGTVGVCDSCCPIVIGEGCTNVGSLRYTALRLANGTISLVDSVTGAAVLPGAIVACANDDLVKVLTAQARQLTNATPWTPGADVVGTLTSLSVTGVAGLWDMVDQNGTVLTGLPAGLTLSWSAEDDNTLTGPTSVTPQLGSSVVANWTQR